MPVSILLAEHLPQAAGLITRLLEQQGYEVTTVHSATEAMAAWEARPTDIVLSRVTFADSLNGVDLARRLEPAGADVILFSPFPADLLDRVPGFSTTAALYIDTRQGFTDLLATVQRFGELRAKRRAGHPGI